MLHDHLWKVVKVTHLLHIDPGIRGDSPSAASLCARARRLARRAPRRHRHLPGPRPRPPAALRRRPGAGRRVPRDQHTAAHAESWALTEELVNEIKEADTILLGLPLYNFGAPSSVKAWVDHLIAPGLSIDPETLPPCSAAATSSCSPAGAGATPKARHARWDHAEPGYRTPSCPPAWNRASSPPSSPSPGKPGHGRTDPAGATASRRPSTQSTTFGPRHRHRPRVSTQPVPRC